VQDGESKRRGWDDGTDGVLGEHGWVGGHGRVCEHGEQAGRGGRGYGKVGGGEMEVPVGTGGQTNWDGTWTNSCKLLADSSSTEVETGAGTYSELAASMLA